ncbi:UDP-N-acetylglucosamine--LPS N-acetylglucosamine transferase [Sphaerochaeta halotolerans]|uniref:UDP-N-acetylglucosamine--LPS N-acetylglucosamine transferase n=1 Tax=Sphaerochaeta halotolerans TaxID=2293840 RepID=A0A372MH54_9SPIR|nr:UDP-N-acetylglucosamine--LPS N-acetylglucosamine transferase [Sphaerochaeta halotolerans]RFU94718.1 UDP-N-acetylglucosamine--LPS N-acetylglucosamine transferase [Sphaerochaeta halotolerans]
MHIAFLYVDAGKGHITPAKALSDAALRLDHTTVVANVFETLKAPIINRMSKSNWRLMLHYPRLEAFIDPKQDSRFNARLFRFLGTHSHAVKDFKAWYDTNTPDCIVVAHFLAGCLIQPIVAELGLPVPVFEYATDVVFTPRLGINSDLDRFYICTQLGKELAMQFGQQEETISICPFPLKTQMMHTEIPEQQQARKKLGLQDRFTVLLNLGGEGIGTTDFLEEVQRRNLDWQIITVGTLSSSTKLHYKHFREKYPSFPIYTPGFVDNIQDYISACDVQAGKAGANALMESLYLKRPFLISNLLYTAKPTTQFFERYKVGWVENSIHKQVDILKAYSEDNQVRQVMAEAFENLPTTFDSDAFVRMIIEDTETFLRKIGVNTP